VSCTTFTVARYNLCDSEPCTAVTARPASAIVLSRHTSSCGSIRPCARFRARKQVLEVMWGNAPPAQVGCAQLDSGRRAGHLRGHRHAPNACSRSRTSLIHLQTQPWRMRVAWRAVAHASRPQPIEHRARRPCEQHRGQRQGGSLHGQPRLRLVCDGSPQGADVGQSSSGEAEDP